GIPPHPPAESGADPPSGAGSAPPGADRRAGRGSVRSTASPPASPGDTRRSGFRRSPPIPPECANADAPAGARRFSATSRPDRGIPEQSPSCTRDNRVHCAGGSPLPASVRYAPPRRTDPAPTPRRTPSAAPPAAREEAEPGPDRPPGPTSASPAPYTESHGVDKKR